MENPFVLIEARLSSLENLLLDLKNETIPNLINGQEAKPQSKVVDLTGLLQARPIIGSRSTIYKKVSAGLIPHSKRGKKLFFDLEAIDFWLLEEKPKTVESPYQEIENHLAKRHRTV